MSRPHLLVVCCFWAGVMGYFYPVFLQDKHLRQPDDEQDFMMNAWVMREEAAQGAPVFWNPAVFSGMPTYVGLSWNSPVVDTMRSLLSLYIAQPMGMLFTMLLCTYIMLLCFTVRPILAAVGAFTFAFSTYPTICLLAGHSERLGTLAYMPLLLGGIQLALQHNKVLWGCLLLSVGLSLQLYANHLQIVYYTLILLLSYTLFCVLPTLKKNQLPRFAKTSIYLLLAGLLGVATAWGSLSSIYAYTKHSTRGDHALVTQAAVGKVGLDKDYAFAYSFRWLEPLTLLIPNFQGGTHKETLPAHSAVARSLAIRGISPERSKTILSALPTYWGDQPISFPNYAGATTIALFALGLFLVSRKMMLWALMLTLLTCMLSWGRNFALFNDFLFDHLPFYNRFRSQGFVLCLPILGFTLVGTMGLEKLLSAPRWHKKCWQPLAGVLGMLVFIFLCSFFFSYRGAIDTTLQQAGTPSWFLSALQEDRQSMLWRDLLRSACFVSVLGGVLYASFRYVWHPYAMILLVGGVVMTDLLPINRRLLSPQRAFSDKHLSARHPATPADRHILQHNTQAARVLYMPNPFNDNTACYRHETAGGYHAAKLRRYNDLIQFGIAPQLAQLRTQKSAGAVNFSDFYVLNMLNIGYFIFGEQDVQHNPLAYGKAWLAKEVYLVPSAEEELLTLERLKSRHSVVIDTTQYSLKRRVFSTEGEVNLLAQNANRMHYNASLDEEALVVFSEIYYPDWKAYVNGEIYPIKRVNYVLRALNLPAGEHDIIFTMAPAHYPQKKWMVWSANYLLLLLLLFTIGHSLKDATGQKRVR